jgi:hypothetical protein
MKVLAPTPESNVSTQIVDGYQLCARCGAAMVTGDNALIAPRLHSWLVYTHHIGPGCPPKAVRGWKAIRFADTVRERPNNEVYRDGESYDIARSRRACVCLLDDKHIKAELDLVEYQPSDEVVASGADFRELLSRFQAGEVGGGKRLNIQGDEENGRKQTWKFLVRNYTEEGLVAAIDGNNLARGLELLVECLALQRRKSYVTSRTAPPVDPTPRAFVDANAVTELSGRRPRGRLSPRADHVLSRDLKGRPVEFPLYSNQKIFENEGKWISEFECRSLKPEPVDLSYSSITHPKLFLWTADSLGQLEPVDSSNPYGPVAMLMRESIEQLNAQREGTFRCENIEWEVTDGSAKMARYEGPEPA